MEKIRITKEFTFDAAHQLPFHPGGCGHLHGHTYRLQVTLIGAVHQVPGMPEDGMVMDFAALKAIVKKQVLDRMDHALIVNESQWQKWKDCGTSRFYLLEGSPTCEQMLLQIVRELNESFKEHSATLFRVVLWETPSSYAEWCLADNS